MTRNTRVASRWTMVTAIALAVTTPAHAFFFRSKPAVTAETTASASTSAGQMESTVGNTAAELQRLMADGGLSEMRTSYNGSYGASLLFHAESLNYYVALFHDRQFWRVIRTDQFNEAEKLFRTFASQTEQLAQVQLDAQRLDASKRYSEKLVAMNEHRLRGLQREMAQQQQQAAAVSQAIEANRQHAQVLSGDLRSTNSQLEALQAQIRLLQAQHLDPNLNLPKEEATVTTTPLGMPGTQN